MFNFPIPKIKWQGLVTTVQFFNCFRNFSDAWASWPRLEVTKTLGTTLLEKKLFQNWKLSLIIFFVSFDNRLLCTSSWHYFDHSFSGRMTAFRWNTIKHCFTPESLMYNGIDLWKHALLLVMKTIGTYLATKNLIQNENRTLSFNCDTRTTIEVSEGTKRSIVSNLDKAGLLTHQ